MRVSIPNWLTSPLTLGVGLYFILLFSGYQFYHYMMAAPEDVLVLEEMSFRESGKMSQSGISDLPEEIRSLPDDWKKRTGYLTSAVYRRTLPLNVSPNRLWAVYLPSVNMNVAVYLNGSLLGSGGSFDEPLARNFNQPQYYTIPNGLLRSGDNVVEIRIQAGLAGEGLLGRVYLGPQELLLDSYQRRYFVRVTVVHGISTAMVILSFLFGVLWLYRRKDGLYGWISLLSLSWAIHDLNLVIVNIPVSTQMWNWLMHATLGGFVISMVLASHRIIEIRPILIERILWWGGLLLTFLLAVLSYTTNWYPILKLLWNSLFAAIGIYPVLRVFLAYKHRHNAELPLVVATGLVIVSFGFHDWMLELGLWERTGGYIIQYSAPVLLFVVSGIVISRFVRSMNETEHLNLELEHRIAAKHLELQENFEQMRALEKENALIEERERIMRDIHDGVGGNLVSALALMEAEKPDATRIRNTIKDGLSNLRIVIDSLDPVENNLTTVLGLWRSRVQPVLEASHLKFQWRVEELPEIDGLGAQKILHVLCILQETVTNILKHANATDVTVCTGIAGDRVFVEISDNGSGFPVHGPVGRGLENMRHRASSIGGEVAISSSDQGTTIHLSLPIHPS